MAATDTAGPCRGAETASSTVLLPVYCSELPAGLGRAWRITGHLRVRGHRGHLVGSAVAEVVHKKHMRRLGVTQGKGREGKGDGQPVDAPQPGKKSRGETFWAA